MNTHRLLLASTSRYRQELLARLALPFEVEAPRVDEALMDTESPSERSLRLARSKAVAVATRNTAAWVIGSDQVAALAGRVLRKPGTEARCLQQLLECAGRDVEFHTSVVLMHQASGHRREHHDLTTVSFRTLPEAALREYVRRERPLDCAGGFKVESLGIRLFERITSTDPTALIGLPLIWLSAALAEAGFEALAVSR